MPAGVRAGFFLSPNRCVAGENTRGARDERRALLFSPATQRFGDKKNPARSSAGTDPPKGHNFHEGRREGLIILPRKNYGPPRKSMADLNFTEEQIMVSPRNKLCFTEVQIMLRREKQKSKNYNKINFRQCKALSRRLTCSVFRSLLYCGGWLNLLSRRFTQGPGPYMVPRQKNFELFFGPEKNSDKKILGIFFSTS